MWAVRGIVWMDSSDFMAAVGGFSGVRVLRIVVRRLRLSKAPLWKTVFLRSEACWGLVQSECPPTC